MSNKRHVYFQPNKKDLKDQYGDCAVRAICKAENLPWLDAYDIMYKYSREVQSPMNCKTGFEYFVKKLGYTYTGISNKRGSKRPTVSSFAKDHTSGTHIAVVSNHYVTIVDGKYYDTWDSGNKCMYGFWTKC